MLAPGSRWTEFSLPCHKPSQILFDCLDSRCRLRSASRMSAPGCRRAGHACTHDRCCVKLRDGRNVGNGVAERPHTIGGLLGGLAVRVQVGILCGRCVIGSVHWRLSDVHANHHENLVRWRAGLWRGATLTQPRVVRHLEPTGTARLPRSHSSRLGRACHTAPRRHHEWRRRACAAAQASATRHAPCASRRGGSAYDSTACARAESVGKHGDAHR